MGWRFRWRKNPTQPDLALWSGAVEQLQRAGIQDVMAIHRGFTVHGQKKYRNAPLWQIPIDFKNAHPDIPLLNDPSHITGKRSMVPDVAQMSVDLGFDGLMVEVHPDPDVAWTDAAQQVTPARFLTLVDQLDFRSDTGGATHEGWPHCALKSTSSMKALSNSSSVEWAFRNKSGCTRRTMA